MSSTDFTAGTGPVTEERLAGLGITLPPVAAPVAAYVPAMVHAGLVRTAGQLPFVNGSLQMTGALDSPDSIEAAKDAAHICALNALAAAAQAAGGVDKLARVVHVTGFVASAPGFVDQPQIINGASELFAEVFGADAGAHTRSAVGVAALPLNASVEVEVTFALA